MGLAIVPDRLNAESEGLLCANAEVNNLPPHGGLSRRAHPGVTLMSLDLPSLSPCDALVALMVAVSASDTRMRTAELLAIERMVNHTPIFASYDADRMRAVSQTVVTLFEEEEGLDAFFGLIREALPQRLFDTAYALACDVAAADGRMGQTEGAMLNEIRDELGIDPLHAAGIEFSARARHRLL